MSREWDSLRCIRRIRVPGTPTGTEVGRTGTETVPSFPEWGKAVFCLPTSESVFISDRAEWSRLLRAAELGRTLAVRLESQRGWHSEHQNRRLRRGQRSDAAVRRPDHPCALSARRPRACRGEDLLRGFPRLREAQWRIRRVSGRAFPARAAGADRFACRRKAACRPGSGPSGAE